MSFRRKLILIFIFMILLPTFVLAAAAYVKSRGIILGSLERQSRWALEDEAQALEDRIQELNKTSVSIAANPDVQAALRRLHGEKAYTPRDRDRIAQILKLALLSRDDIESIGVYGLEGQQVIFDNNRYNAFPTLSPEDFKLAEQAKGGMVWLPYFPENGTTACIRAINDLAGQTPIGYLAMHVYADKLLPPMTGASFFKSGGLYLTNSDGSPMILEDQGLLAKARSGGDNYLVMEQGIAKTPWRLVGALPVLELQRDIVVIRNWTILYALILFGIGVVAAVLLSRSLTRPISRLMESLSHAERENVLLPIAWNTNDEIGRVISAYNRMGGKLNKAEGDLRRAYGEMEERVVMRTRELDQANKELKDAKEAAESASLTKSAFLANMSHEIRTPLNGLMGMLQLTAQTPLNKQQEEYVANAYQASKRLNRLLSDILDLSRVEAGKMEIVMAPFDLREGMNTVFQLFKPFARERGVELEMHLDPDLPSGVTGDVTRLQQVLNNLVSNAIKFSDHGTVRIEVSLLRLEPQGRCRALFSVSDKGIGIPDSVLGKLFTSFSQADGGYHRRFRGVGLGLAISKRLTDMMGGALAVESVEGEGTTFYLSLPFERAEVPIAGPSTIEEACKDCSGLKILAAEDDAISRLFVHTQLKRLGHEACVVEDGLAALEALRNGAFDLVLLDVQMPKLDGVETTRAIRQGDAGEANRGIPILALTAYAMRGDKETFIAAGMDGYLNKPLEVEALHRALCELLRSKGGIDAAP